MTFPTDGCQGKTFSDVEVWFGLQKNMDQNKKGQSLGKTNEDATSFRKMERASGIRHASIVKIVNGEKNASWSTIDALLEGLEMTLTDFAAIYDSITEKEVVSHQKEITRKKLLRVKQNKQ